MAKNLTNKKTYVCRKMKVCVYLLNNGFHYTDIQPNVNDPSKNVWIFTYTDKLRAALDEYYESNKREYVPSENSNPVYVCRRLRLCSYLVENGFEILQTCIDKQNPKYNVWLFSDTKQLRDKVEDYYRELEILKRGEEKTLQGSLR